ncbi:MAG: lipid-A-disaccharide synthase [Cytophagaceae bacterium]
MRYFIIAGERSGDLHASNLIRAIKKSDPEAEFFAWGGEMMETAGATILKHYQAISFMGFFEVILNLRKIFKAIKDCKRDIDAIQPDVFIPVDFAGFNLKIAKYAVDKGIPVYYYISPKIWAWNQKRAFKIKRLVKHIFVILPFEVSFYEKFGVKADYIGNPLLDAIAAFDPEAGFAEKNGLSGKSFIALLPGSRFQEVAAMKDEILPVIKNFSDHQFVVAAVSNLPKDVYDVFRQYKNVNVITDRTYDILSLAEAAIVTSGTATLETALFSVPQLVVYKASPVTYHIVKRLIRVPYISLVNLILGKEAVPELIQKRFNAEIVSNKLDSILKGEEREKQLSCYSELKSLMGEAGASEKAAKLIVSYLKK